MTGSSAPATADSLQQSLLEALATIGGTLQSGMSGASHGPSMAADQKAATLRLRATVERYFQF